jgi:hypothetical protein
MYPCATDCASSTLAEPVNEIAGAHAASDQDRASEARASRAGYRALRDGDKRALIAFLENLVLFTLEEEEEGAAAAPGSSGETERRPVKIRPKGFRIRLNSRR